MPAPRVVRDRDVLVPRGLAHEARDTVLRQLAVGSEELAQARDLLCGDAPAVFGRAGAMCEPATHARWAEALVRRADLFGVADPLPFARQA